MIEYIANELKKKEVPQKVNPTVVFVGWMIVIMTLIGVGSYNYQANRQNECVVNLMQYDNTTAAEAKDACK